MTTNRIKGFDSLLDEQIKKDRAENFTPVAGLTKEEKKEAFKSRDRVNRRKNYHKKKAMDTPSSNKKRTAQELYEEQAARHAEQDAEAKQVQSEIAKEIIKHGKQLDDQGKRLDTWQANESIRQEHIRRKQYEDRLVLHRLAELTEAGSVELAPEPTFSVHDTPLRTMTPVGNANDFMATPMRRELKKTKLFQTPGVPTIDEGKILFGSSCSIAFQMCRLTQKCFPRH